MTAVSNIYPTAALRAADAAHHIHPFTDTKALNAEGSRIIPTATASSTAWPDCGACRSVTAGRRSRMPFIAR